MKEIWKSITEIGFEDLYQVSSFGRVKSNGCEYIRSDGRRHVRFERILNPLSVLGYQDVVLYNKRNKKQIRVHRLVANAFLSNINNKPEVNHINGNRADNRLINLEWCTKNENMHHSHYVLNKKANQNKMVIQKTLASEYIKTWPSLHEIYRSLGFSRRNIQANINGKYKYAYGFKWEYAQ